MSASQTPPPAAVPSLSLENVNIQTFFNLVLRDLEREPRLAVSVWFMGLTIFYLLYLLSRKSYDPKQQRRLTKHEEETLISEWRPVPLTPALPENLRKRKAPIVESAVGAYVAIEGKRYLNFASTNFLGIANSREIKDAALKAVDKYGVGSCGPRGFYGSIDVHLHLEAAIAKFYGVDHCILYSDGFAAISTSLPPFAKKGDLLVVDEGANFAIQSAANLSRATIVWFKHNDMKDLEAKLQEIKKKDERKGVKKPYPRFIVVEGLYQYTGEICNLKQVVALAQQYKYRMYVDDSLALGVLGKSGRGSLEHWNIPATEIDLLCAALDNSVAAVGGFCVGTKHAVDHQRLSASGYCFSASAPPYCSTAAIAALGIIDEKPQLSASVRQKAARMRKGLDGIKGVVIGGDQASPVIHIRLSPSRGVDKDTEIMERVAQQLISNMVLVHVSQYVPGDHRPPAPSLKVLVNASHADGDIDSTADMIKFAFGSLRL